jgi:hypothetical protein
MAPSSESKKKLQADRRAAGLCIQCGAPANGKSRCQLHAAQANVGRKKQAADRKAAGVCQTCGARPAMANKTVCQICSDKASAVRMNNYNKWKAAGKCTNCGSDTRHPPLCDTCEPKIRQSQQEYHRDRYKRLAADKRCPQCGNPHDADTILCPGCAGKQVLREKASRQRLKLQVIEAYGGPICAGCNENNPAILEIDHIDGGGRKHMDSIGGPGKFYRWLKSNNYPDGFQILCPTCNKKAHKGIPLPKEG